MSSAAFLSPYNQHPTPYPPSAPEVPDHFDGSPYSKPPPPIRYLAMERELQQNALQVFALVVSRFSVLVLERDCYFNMFWL